MDHNDEKIGFRLIQLIFGKMAGNKFLKQGIYNVLYEEKKYLIKFVNQHLKESDSENHNQISIFKDPKICEKILMNSKYSSLLITDESSSHKQFSEKDLKVYISLKEQTNALNKIKSKLHFKILTNHKIIKDLIDNEVPVKYVDHLIWLIVYDKSIERVREFRNLLFDVYVKNKGILFKERKD